MVVLDIRHKPTAPRTRPPSVQAPCHNGLVVYTRRWQNWFRLEWVVRCHHCDLRLGPFATSKAEANELARSLTSMPGCKT